MKSKPELAKSLLDTTGIFGGYNLGEPFHTHTNKEYSPRKGERVAYAVRQYSPVKGSIVHYAYIGHAETRPWDKERKDVEEDKGRGRKLYRNLGLHIIETYPHICAITGHITNPIAMVLRQKIWDEEFGMESYVLDSSSGEVVRISDVRGALEPHQHHPLEIIREYTNPTTHPMAERFSNSGYKVVSVLSD